MFNLEDTLNELEDGFKEVNKMASTLLDASLEPFEFIYQQTGDKKLYETMDQKQKDDLISSLKNDLLPLFEENKSTKGIKKINSLIKDLEK